MGWGEETPVGNSWYRGGRLQGRGKNKAGRSMGGGDEGQQVRWAGGADTCRKQRVHGRVAFWGGGGRGLEAPWEQGSWEQHWRKGAESASKRGGRRGRGMNNVVELHGEMGRGGGGPSRAASREQKRR